MRESRHVRYHGRHRTASTASTATRLTAVSAVGVGAAVASLLAPAAASAATSGQWDRVAQCESGGNWADNTGNGYYGGLQFSPSTWAGYGGHAYAAEASGASASAQMAVADKVLAAQGWGAWPVCSRIAGVSGEPSAEGVHTQHLASTSTHTTHYTAPHHVATPTYVPHIKGAHYKVKSGDSLSAIAERHSVRGGWETIYQVNRTVIGDNPSLIRPGMKLKI